MWLQVLEACMKNCGRRFHNEVGKFRFLNELIKVVSPKVSQGQSPHSRNSFCVPPPLPAYWLRGTAAISTELTLESCPCPDLRDGQPSDGLLARL